jgi:hypothetical protein
MAARRVAVSENANEEGDRMGVRVSGGSFSVLGIGINWERTPGAEKIARAVISFLEDRRLLFGSRHIEDEAHCVSSALDCRTFSPNRSLRPNLENR